MPLAVTSAKAISLPGADVVLYENALSEAGALFQRILEETPWRQEHIKLFGRRHAMPRLTCWMGDVAYTYSGLVNRPAPWSDPVDAVRCAAERLAGVSFNGVLLNLYRTGGDSMGWHADDESSLGPCPVIASVNLGAVRRLRFKAKPHFAAAPVSVELPSASILLMQGDTQRNWLHAVPKTSRAVGPRINLTFRAIGPD